MQLLSAFVVTNRPVDFNPYVRAENRRPTDGRRFIYWRKGSGAGSLSLSLVLPFSRRFFCPKQDSIWPLPTVLPSKRNHHCLRVWLNGPRRARDWSAASSINLISNALSAFASSSRFFAPPVTALAIVDLLNPWTSRNFQFFPVPREESSLLGACCSSVLLAGIRKLESAKVAPSSFVRKGGGNI